MTRILTISILLTAAVGLGLAQASPNFSGEWKLNVAKSSFGGMPAPESASRRIKHEGAMLGISIVQKGARGELASEFHYTTDGKPSVNKVQGGESQGSAHWDGSKLIIESSREFQGAVLKQREVWALSGDSKTLTIDTHVSIPNGEFDVKQVLEKQ